ncbi:hypothetical protein HCN44_002908 [Aphidius gifuensis]|uniref:Rho-GAP domain-containing protein n=1 Tax=Aphidius gifuensis TaxID=684658 RepID=A0A834XRA8_APHGI|nr:rho GTPase-activating protein conundrum [Aphidius gifuensis]XP_044010645.1 rho GTPase-activating protein conundrum [Aphidius gifuensis]XP_044010646.1 rho GTPase-activating protein conundrum [Aphidius gifuensis]XP_044010647.1 rho GTPase-activating protein conundrum [Aphidius gifuensis]XP_044010648.1 rho GTPase-activating protein conundrum [Aphidius gifuensis]XP_044010649.1 rho GTPase-activating protein conundrum [Aphidius gifuensis]XP_044010650.1 rho GTPase-activating protein conundrum [Aph
MDRAHGMTYSGGEAHLHEYWEAYQKMVEEETRMLDEYLDEHEECSPRSYDEGEAEAEWLRAAGLGELTEPWKAGREVQPEEIGAACYRLSKIQTEAVKRRVRSLNHTVKQRFNQRTRAKKPDIRDVFKDVEVSSTGTRSRSATPDSLDSMTGETTENILPSTISNDTNNNNINVPNFVSIFNRPKFGEKETIRRLTSAPIIQPTNSPTTSTTTTITATATTTPSSSSSAAASSSALPLQEIFRKTGHNWSHRGDIASDTEGIQLTGFHRFGTIHWSMPVVMQKRSDSDPSEVSSTTITTTTTTTTTKTTTTAAAATTTVNYDDGAQVDLSNNESTLKKNNTGHNSVTRSHSSLYGLNRPIDNIITRPLNRTSSHGHLSFEQMWKANDVDNRYNNNNDDDDDGDDDMETWKNNEYDDKQKVEMMSQRDITRLQPLLWLELSAVFDKYNVPLVKRKPAKRRRKAGNLFGVSLSTLLLRDSQLTNDENNIPLVFQKLLNELSSRGIKEEGILRVGGNKQKVEALCCELEMDFYSKPKDIDKILKKTTCQDLSAVLKKLLRDLPQPLLTVELIDAFYQSHGVKNSNELSYSLNLLVLLLPVEHRCTLKVLLEFFNLIINHQNLNKMSIHNVAMIAAPSLFPPRYIHPFDRTDLTAQVNMAAVCCQVTQAMIINVDKLWHVPSNLICQLRRQSEEERFRKYKKKY